MSVISSFVQRRILRKLPSIPISIEISPKHKFEGHEDTICSFVFLQDNVHVVTGSFDGTIRKWNCDTGLLVGEPWEGNNAIRALALSPDGKTIGCGREDGTVERWKTGGEIIEDIWTSHSDIVPSLSWSPSGDHLASGSYDGTILIREAESGQVEVGPIKTNQRWVYSVAYSPLGDRIASAGSKSICIWDSHTGDLLVGPIKGLGYRVLSVVWSLDGTKLYFTSDQFARVFDSTSGTVLHRFQHDDYLDSIALSPTHNVLACMGWSGVAQLWDTESCQPLARAFHEGNRNSLGHVSFSPDGQYLAYGGGDNTITLMSVKVMLPIPASNTNAQGDTRQETLLKSASPNVHSTNPLAQSAVDDIIDEIYDNPYNDFFAAGYHTTALGLTITAESSLPFPPSSKRHVLFPSPFHAATNESMSFHERIAPQFHFPRALSNSPLHVPAISERTEPTPKGNCGVGSEDEDCDDVHYPANVAPGTAKPSNHNGKQREESIPHIPLLHTIPLPPLDSDENVVEIYPIRVPEILSMNTAVRNACIANDLFNAQELLTRQIIDHPTNYSDYANRSFMCARQSDWDNALHDALQSLSVQPSLIGYISKGVALCGKMDFKEATKAFDIAFMFAAADSNTILLLLLVKAIALFNVNQHDEAMSRIQDLSSACPNPDTLTCHIVQAYLNVQLGINASNGARHSDAANHFTAAINIGVLSHEQSTHPKYDIFVILFGWDLATLWQTANQGRCYALLRADRLVEARAAYKYMMDECDAAMKANCLDWSTAFQKECSARYVVDGDTALAENAHDRAIELYSAAIDLDPASDAIFANRCKAKLGKMLWEEALDDVRKVIELNPSSFLGYELRHAALHGVRRYNEAVEAFEFILLNFDLDNSHDLEMQTFKKESTVLYTASGNAALAARAYDNAIQLYSVAIDLDPIADSVFANRCKAKMGCMQWEEALGDAEKVIEINPSSYIGYHLKHAALHGAQRYDEAIEALRLNLSKLDDTRDPEMQAFKREYNALYTASGNDAFAVRAYDRAIQLYSVTILLNPATGTTFANRCKAKLAKMLWQEALIDAEKVTEFDPSSYLGYDLKHAALHGAQRYDEAIEAFQLMLVRLDDAYGSEMQALRRRYISRSEAQGAIQKVIATQMENSPPRLFNTSTGRLCDRDAQIHSFTTSTEYKELLSLTMKHPNLPPERMRQCVLMFFQYVMLSHRWEGKEPLLHDIQGQNVYKLNPADGTAKLQSFCKIARDRGYRWAWSDTCCIDKNNIIDLQQSVNSMFVWYRHSALTIIYLSCVLPSSKPGALAKSVWISRGWTVQEFLAPNVVLFFQKDWTLYLDDHSSNHKESPAIMQELADATGINMQALVAFRPEMKGAREKLQWSSMRVTTLQEDIAYSLFGVFAVHLSPIYGEKRQNALGRLLQEIISQSGDITCLDWVGQTSEFNSCLPANISSYAAPSFVPPSLSEDEMGTLVSSLRDAGAGESASQLYAILDQLDSPRLANRRLRLPCIVFTITQVTPMPSQEHETCFTYAVKANGLHDLLVTTEDKRIPFFARRRKLLLVRPWDRDLLELDDFADHDAENMTPKYSSTLPGSSLRDDASADLGCYSQALRLVVRLGLPFRALLLAQQRNREYSRIAADRDITVQVKNGASVRDLMDARMLEIL